MGLIWWFFSFYSYGNWGFERLRNSFKVMQLTCDRDQIRSSLPGLGLKPRSRAPLLPSVASVVLSPQQISAPCTQWNGRKGKRMKELRSPESSFWSCLISDTHSLLAPTSTHAPWSLAKGSQLFFFYLSKIFREVLSERHCQLFNPSFH